MFHKNLIRTLFVVVLFISSSGAFALPGLSVGVMGGANLAMPSVGSSKVGYSLGPTFEAGPLQASALYSKYMDSKYLDLPVLYSMGIGLASVGLGGFYGLCLDSGATSDDHNYGAVANVRVKIPGGLFADGRFNLGLKELGGSKLSSAAVMLGFNFL
jgi:hypothetical protein